MPTTTTIRSGLLRRTHVKAGQLTTHHNAPLVRAPRPAPGLKVKTQVKAGTPSIPIPPP